MTHPSSKQTGSALLLTLLVTSLLLLMTLGFAAFVRIELRASVNHQHLYYARANARLGAELAAARLQQLLGPDQRVSANADLLRGTRGNLYRPALNRHDRNRAWSGVWDAAAFNENDPADKPFLGWLVSSPNSAELEQPDFAASPADPGSADWIRLAGPGVSMRPGDHVYSRRVPLPNSDTGAYAFWVADEGVKARFNLSDPYRGTADFTKRQYSMKAAQRHAAELFTYDDSTPLSAENLYPLDSPVFDELRERVILPGQMPYIAPPGSLARERYRQLRFNRFHDMTYSSRGVLSDTRNGGLRQDLSLAFEMSLDDFNQSVFGGGSPHAELPVYRPAGYPSAEEIAPVLRITDFSPFGFQPENSVDDQEQNPARVLPPVLRGPPWHLFRNFHRMYKQSDPDRASYGLPAQAYQEISGHRVYQGRSLFPATNAWSFSRRYGQDPATWTHAELYGPQNENYTRSAPLGRPIFPGISPIVSRTQFVISLRSETDPDQPVNRVLDVYLTPVVTLWNPYNVPISTGAPNGQPLQLSIKYLDVRLEMRVRDGSTHQVGLFELFRDTDGNSGSSVYDRTADEAFQLSFDVPGGFTMDPGELIIFSPSGPVSYARTRRSLIPLDGFSGVNLDLKPGIAFLPDNAGIHFPNAWNVSLLPGAEFDFRTRTLGGSGAKFQVTGVSRTAAGNPSGIEPFFSSFEAGALNMNTDWGGWIPANHSDLSTRTRPFFQYDAYLKPENTLSPVNLLSHFNIRAATYEQGLFINSESGMYSPQSQQEDLWFGRAAALQSWNGTWLSTHGSRGAYWGDANTATGSRFVTLFEIPRLPPLSLGALQHAPVVYMADEPTFPIANSYASPFVDLDAKLSEQPLNNRSSGSFPNNLLRWPETRSPWKRQKWTMTRADWSYLLNETLWDSYFFSSITPPAQGGEAIDAFLQFQNGTPLPNSLYTHFPRPGEELSDIQNKLFHPTGPRPIRPRAPQQVAENLMLEGAFNINSTSVEAWRVILSSTRNLIINVQNNSAPIAPDGTVFTRTALPFDLENDKWHGFRNLSDVQIDRLATEIVRQIHIRGPFLNLSDFINRRLAPSGHASQKSGPLQAAIDAAGLNDSFSATLQNHDLQLSQVNDWVRPRIDPQSPVAMGAPGYLTQADLLTLIGPMLTARSDTFTVRAYGEHGGAKAWCELSLQRVPEYVDSTRSPGQAARWAPSETPGNSPAGYDTVLPRRRFVVTSFRWLNEEDI